MWERGPKESKERREDEQNGELLRGAGQEKSPEQGWRWEVLGISK